MEKERRGELGVKNTWSFLSEFLGDSIAIKAKRRMKSIEFLIYAKILQGLLIIPFNFNAWCVTFITILVGSTTYKIDDQQGPPVQYRELYLIFLLTYKVKYSEKEAIYAYNW